MVPRPVIAGKNGKIIDIPVYQGLGMSGSRFFPLFPDMLIPLPHGSTLMVLPHRFPVVFDHVANKPVELRTNPFYGKPCFAVAAFISPGWTVTHNAAYVEANRYSLLPLFAYAGAVWYKGKFYVTAVRTDRERRQDIRLMNQRLIKDNVRLFKKEFRTNRLVKHLARCALVYCCPAARNLFLMRYECPLPTARACNAGCIGCISLQPSGCCPVTQPRIAFTPSAEEVAEVALMHFSTGPKRIASFGQGCEGEPLCNGNLLLKSVKHIRAVTSRGTINLNTNASKPELLCRLFDGGLDSIRVSLNSVRPHFYNQYFRPRSYQFKDVLTSIRKAGQMGKFVSINYFVQPGFTDSVEEADSLFRFLEKYQVHMIQWRNLNYDPVAYFNVMFKGKKEPSRFFGIKNLIAKVKNTFPHIKHGYFNPPKEKFI